MNLINAIFPVVSRQLCKPRPIQCMDNLLALRFDVNEFKTGGRFYGKSLPCSDHKALCTSLFQRLNNRSLHGFALFCRISASVSDRNFV